MTRGHEANDVHFERSVLSSRRERGLLVEEPIWLNDADRVLYGWITRPMELSVAGGVVLAPPIGRDIHASRRAYRRLALLLAEAGFVVLRIDYPGTGDSSQSLEDANLETTWTKSVAAAVQYLEKAGVREVSAVGLRFGAVVAGLAGAQSATFSSLVLWDPVESGRSFLREQSALEALRRDKFNWNVEGSVETSEMVFTPALAGQLYQLNLSQAPPNPMARRVLALVREDRAIPSKLRERLERESITWETTTEQPAMLETEPLNAVLAENSMRRIVEWLSLTQSDTTDQFTPIPSDESAIVGWTNSNNAVRERFLQLGPNGLFAISTEPDGPARGPWIIMLNVSNEAHTGPSRLWVDLSRRWAGLGLRCLRFDLSGIGDSPKGEIQGERLLYDLAWNKDVLAVAHAISSDNPSQVVLVGLCSGAFLAAEAALALNARGACLINPPVGTNVLHGVAALEGSHSATLRSLGARLKRLGARHRWVAAGLWQVGRVVMPRPYSEDLLAELAKQGTSLLVLASVQDLSPYPDVPVLRSIDRRRVVAPRGYEAQVVPDLDHSMLVSEGRERVVKILDQHIVEMYAREAPDSH
jgi:pimeloyl-ACP methyl ester carboxylesterase